MKKYKDKFSGNRIVEVDDLSFLRERNHRYGWLRRHYFHRRYKRACRRADMIIAQNETVAVDLVRYYFVPKWKITLPQIPESTSRESRTGVTGDPRSSRG